jgi:heterodisulfide reductase subunit C
MQRCPQRIEITELFVDLKNAAAESRRIPEPLFERAKRIAETGRSTPNSKASLVWREKLGLAPPNDVNVEEVRVLLESVKFLGSLERRRNGLDGASS